MCAPRQIGYKRKHRATDFRTQQQMTLLDSLRTIQVTQDLRRGLRLALGRLGRVHGARLGQDIKEEASVLGGVEAHLLGLLVHAGEAEVGQDAEHDGHGATDPGEDEAHQQKSTRDGLRLTTVVEEAGALHGAVRVVGVLVVEVGGEGVGGDHTPGAAEAVDRDGVHDVVDLEPEKQLRAVVVDEATDDANGERAVRLARGARAGDGDEAGEHAVAHEVHVNVSLVDLADNHGGERTRGSTDGGGHHGLGGDGGEANDVEGGHAVETVPAEPEDEGAEVAKDSALARDLDGGSIRGEAALWSMRNRQQDSHR
eukprot:scaffold1534_cov267-Pinguiococcus_pyrenoidosus.AAC.9